MLLCTIESNNTGLHVKTAENHIERQRHLFVLHAEIREKSLGRKISNPNFLPNDFLQYGNLIISPAPPLYKHYPPFFAYPTKKN